MSNRMKRNRTPMSGWRWMAAAAVVTTALTLTVQSRATLDPIPPAAAATLAGSLAQQDEGTPETQAQPAPAEGEAGPIETAPTDKPLSEITSFDPAWQVFVPPLAAILLAIIFRAVVPALFIGVLIGSYMMLPEMIGTPYYATVGSIQDAPLFIMNGFRATVEQYIIGGIVEGDGGSYNHATIIVFTMAIGFMIGVMGRNGGTSGMVQLVAGETKSRRRGALTAWLSGMFVFFDDYANAMIVGPTMAPVFDRLKLSRAKLAYIVDSTAAPVASVLLGTWVGAEIDYINNGLNLLAASPGGTPEFLMTDGQTAVGAMSLFWQSVPYRFYALFAIIAVFLVALLCRDFGPMKKSETAALAALDDGRGRAKVVHEETVATPRWWLGLLPVLTLLGVTIAILYQTGVAVAVEAGTLSDSMSIVGRLTTILDGADPYRSILYGAVAAATLAMVLTLVTRACSIRDAADAGLDGMTRVSGALVILALAWALSKVAEDLKLGEVVGFYLQHHGFPPLWLPVAIFTSAAIVSFATGTSWGTMGILTPVAVQIGAQFAATSGSADPMSLFLSCVGAVLAGAVFGDHCSPISDTTVLSSLASGCRHEEHVWTQMPYAVVTALVAVGCGNVVCDVYNQPWYYGLGAGTVLLFLVFLIFGRRPKPPQTTGPRSIVPKYVETA